MFQKLQIRGWAAYLAIAVLLFAIGYRVSESSAAAQSNAVASLRNALLFHAGFDDGPDASFAKGDKRLYTAPSYKEQEKATPGIGNPDVEIVSGGGKFQNALKFNQKNLHAIFYRAENNVAYSPAGWDGTISFWLSLDPAVDLALGATDPIQITDSAFNDACVWVDFTRANPRQFRLGVFGELKVWNPQNLPGDKNPDFTNRLVVVDPPPFSRGKWTHVVITHRGLGSVQGGTANLYLDGRLQGTKTGISEPFTWDMSKAAIRVGVNYVGLFDELAIFNRPLTEAEIQALAALKGGVRDLRP